MADRELETGILIQESKPTRSAVAEKLFTLLKEIDEICHQKKIPYFLETHTALAAYLKNELPEGLIRPIISMHAKDLPKFIDGVKQRNDPNRFLEYMGVSPHFPNFILHYGDMNSIYCIPNSMHLIQYCGLRITIAPLRRSNLKSLRYRILYSLESAWECTNTTRHVSVKRSISKFCTKLLCGIVGYRRYSGWLFRQLVAVSSQKKGTLYTKALWSRISPKKDFLYLKTTNVAIYGTYFTMSHQPVHYFDSNFKKWRGTEISIPKVDYNRSIVSAYVPFSRIKERFGKDWERKLWQLFEQQRVLVSKRDHFAGLNASNWDKVTLTGTRFYFWQTMMPHKAKIINLFQKEKYPLIRRIMAPYLKALQQSIRQGTPLCFDKELFEIALYVLYEKAPYAKILNIKAKVPAAHLRPITIEQFTGVLSQELKPARSAVAEKLFTLLKEIDEICRQQKIPYFLETHTALAAYLKNELPEGLIRPVISMHAKDLPKFIDGVKQRNDPDRFLEYMGVSPHFPNFILHYGDMNSIYCIPNSMHLIQYCGLRVTIAPLRRSNLKSLRYRVLYGLESAWECTNTTRHVSVKRSISKFCTKLLCGIVGYRRYSGWLFRQLVAVSSQKKGTLYTKALWSRISPKKDFLYLKTTKVAIYDTYFTMSHQPVHYFDSNFKKWRGTEISIPKVDYNRSIVSAYVPFSRVKERFGKDWERKLWQLFEQQRVLVSKRDHFAGLNASNWDKVTLTGTRFYFWQTMMPLKAEIMDLFQKEEYLLIRRIMAPYLKALQQSIRQGTPLCFDKELFEIALYVLYEKAPYAKILNIKAKVPAAHLRPITIEQFKGVNYAADTGKAAGISN